MVIQFGSIEYFELLNFRDKLMNRHLDRLDLLQLDRLRNEVEIKVLSIHEKHKQDHPEKYPSK